MFEAYKANSGNSFMIDLFKISFNFRPCEEVEPTPPPVTLLGAAALFQCSCIITVFQSSG